MSHNDTTPLLVHSSYTENFKSIPIETYETKEDIGANKLGTFDGVFIPTALNVLSILMFLRFGFIIGQLGILGSLGVLIMSYLINLLTTLSISAIATNGTVRGGGAYYMISRSLGPEFGGSIGLIFYIGQVLNSALNVVGIIEPLLINFGSKSGEFWKILPQGYWYEFLYSSLLLFLCICIALVGSALVSRAGSLLFVLLLISTISIPISVLFVKPFEEFDTLYTGPTWETFSENFMPHLTKGAAGSLLNSKETFNDLFGIFFPATAGIFAGASMSGDLRKPSKSIPKGTLWGLVLTFFCYSLVILALGSSVPRSLLYKDVQIIQNINISAPIILMGELATSLFSIIVGVVGAAAVLQAIARDSIFPFLKVFEKISKGSNNPINAILFTWLLTQLFLFANINQIATFITMAFLMTFIVTNLACFLLKIASAPNFRPSFRYFDWYTALSGLFSCIVAMFIVDGISASLVVIFLMFLFMLIHYTCPPKPWGDVSQSLIYHQVRKYLLRLRQDNVKYWRPQILLLVDSPRSSWNLIQFCNNLKKGGLYILGHVIVTESFQNNFNEFKTQTNAWIKLRDILKVKAFVQIGLGPTLPWGIRNVILGSGLGGMKPNIVVLGFHENKKLQSKTSRTSSKSRNYMTAVNVDKLPTDVCRNENRVSVQNWVCTIEDLILMRTNVAVAKGFNLLNIPSENLSKKRYEDRKFIDLYPIQMSAEIVDKNGEKSALTTNFDTYTLILQLGAILTTVPNWKKTHRLRIVLFVEYEEDIINEKERINSLIGILRIKAVLVVVCLKNFKTYDAIINGTKENFYQVDKILRNDDFWTEVKELRLNQFRANIPLVSIQQPRFNLNSEGSIKFGENGAYSAKKYGISKLQKMGVSFSMTTKNLFKPELFHNADDEDSYYDDTNSDLESSYTNDSSRYHEHLTDQFKPKDLEENFPNPNYRPKLQQKYSDQGLNRETSSQTLNPAIKSLKKKPLPNFSSEKLPRSKVIDDATGDEPSIMLLPDNDSISSKKLNPGERSTKILKKDEFIKSAYKSNSKQEPIDDTPAGGIDINNLSFNDLPAKAQHLILNDVMKTISNEAAVIFSTLPAPIIGTHYSEADCEEYLKNLEIWCDDLPPIMLINSQSMTVTTAL
ncbi:hypothetical protein WICMUC_004462 [Wickerhamomyces mucosus]|uniref:Vacuolar cation-chloride cotransporter 1 n=1 Tax=Wickerhamomyces mucosus TaxID=1378264 RepID=A0A9P8TAM1_9ASCO|nr:hypothetical protein WICMUC_004462 [Wickerhamomyces mucosus]